MKNAYKKRILSVSLLALTIALLCVMLTACGLFNALKEIKSVEIIVGEGLEESADGYIATLGTTFTLSADWKNRRVVSPALSWHVRCGEEDREIGDTKTLSFAFERDDLGNDYYFYVVVNEDVKSDEVKITPQEAPLSAPTIVSASHTITNGQIQQNRLEEMSNVVLSVEWNKSDISQDLQIEIAWYVDGDKQGEEENFVFDVSQIDNDCTIVISVEIGYTTQDGDVRKSANITLSFVSEYLLAQKVLIAPSEDGGRLQRLCADTYYWQKRTADESVSVSFDALLSPSGAKQDAKCTWTVYVGDTKTELDDNGRTVSVPIAQGKNVIKASIGNVESRQIIVYCFTSAYDDLQESVKSNIVNKFVWNGNSCDTYISSQRDLNAYVAYAVSCHQKNVDYEMYVAVDAWKDKETFKEKCVIAMDNIDESGGFVYSMSLSSTKASIKFSEETVFGIPSGAYASTAQVSQAKTYLRYSEQDGERTTLPVDNYTEELVVKDSNDLYRAVSNGYKPKFEGENATALSTLYQKARNVLTKYITDDMSEVEKVAIIYDWIVYEIDYDIDVAEMGGGIDVSGYNAFYLEGVFNDGRAVCDGKSKAFALLCGMEGIKALRIRGYANSELSSLTDAQKKECGHAWNKVLVDANGDGEREWYVVDTTWGDASVKSTSTTPYKIDEYLSYSYFLRTDADVSATHESSMEQPLANTAYNTYKNTFINIGEKTVDLYIESKAELQELLAYSTQNGQMCLSVYIVESVRGENFNHLSATRDGEYVIYGATSIVF